MPVIRFIREGQDVECYPGENLREVALREGIELYGIKGKLGNCGGCGQCITCFVEVMEEEGSPAALSPRTGVEDKKLLRRPQTWRLACQSLVQRSLLVLTRPQVGLGQQASIVQEARSRPLPAGPTTWPEGSGGGVDGDEEVDQTDGTEVVKEPSTTGDEGPIH